MHVQSLESKRLLKTHGGTLDRPTPGMRTPPWHRRMPPSMRPAAFALPGNAQLTRRREQPMPGPPAPDMDSTPWRRRASNAAGRHSPIRAAQRNSSEREGRHRETHGHSATGQVHGDTGRTSPRGPWRHRELPWSATAGRTRQAMSPPSRQAGARASSDMQQQAPL